MTPIAHKFQLENQMKTLLFTIAVISILNINCGGPSSFNEIDEDYDKLPTSKRITKIVIEQNAIQKDISVPIKIDYADCDTITLFTRTKKIYAAFDTLEDNNSLQYRIYDDSILYILKADFTLEKGSYNESTIWMVEPSEYIIDSIFIKIPKYISNISTDTSESYNDYVIERHVAKIN